MACLVYIFNPWSFKIFRPCIVPHLETISNLLVLCHSQSSYMLHDCWPIMCSGMSHSLCVHDIHDTHTWHNVRARMSSWFRVVSSCESWDCVTVTTSACLMRRLLFTLRVVSCCVTLRVNRTCLWFSLFSSYVFHSCFACCVLRTRSSATVVVRIVHLHLALECVCTQLPKTEQKWQTTFLLRDRLFTSVVSS